MVCVCTFRSGIDSARNTLDFISVRDGHPCSTLPHHVDERKNAAVLGQNDVLYQLCPD